MTELLETELPETYRLSRLKRLQSNSSSSRVIGASESQGHAGKAEGAGSGDGSHSGLSDFGIQDCGGHPTCGVYI